MMVKPVEKNEIFGLVRPDIDAHTLGVSTVGKLIKDCGFKVHICNARVAHAVANISKLDNISLLAEWIKSNKISRLGFSYRLDPVDAQYNFGKVYTLLKDYEMFKEQGGPLNQIYFSGLPEACYRIRSEYDNQVTVFIGDETQVETLRKLGIPESLIPKKITEGSAYDSERMKFARELIQKGDWKFVLPRREFSYKNFGTKKDSLAERIYHNRKPGNPPLMRVHVGPYNPDYEEAKREFRSWLNTLSDSRFLDIVSIGSSQLSQSDFGGDWGDKPNGGGVPINSEQDLINIWEASRPMLIRTYAGTQNIPHLADVYERTINIAWHALSFWWFNQADGRGPYAVKKNLEQHIETLQYIAETGKPFEPNIPHHFAFRGGDDYTYVLSSYLAARMAKKTGVKYIVIQVMLNTPKYTWGVQDLAKARSLLKLVRELEDDTFKVFLQPRAGLDYFSPDFDKAKMQLAAVSAMMDDIEPANEYSPDIIHVVSYCEAVKLATPVYINESIQITIKSIEEYRNLKKAGLIDSMIENTEVNERTMDLYREVKNVTKLAEKHIPDLYSAEGLYQVFKKGIFTAPYLWECQQEFKNAIKWNTDLVNGGVRVVDEHGQVINTTKRVESIFA